MDRVFQVSYNEIDGHLSVFYKGIDPGTTIIIGEGTDMFISIFCRWCAKINDISNQPDKPFGYVGKKPKLKTVRKNFLEFKIAYDYIKQA